jgi:hypothetical protein
MLDGVDGSVAYFNSSRFARVCGQNVLLLLSMLVLDSMC